MSRLFRLFAVVFVLALAACGGKESPVAPEMPAPPPPPPPPPSYQGNWTGGYSVGSCRASGPGGAGFCTQLFPTGRFLPIVFQLSQNGTTVTGRVLFGALTSEQFTAPIRPDRGLTIITVLRPNANLTMNVFWDLDLIVNGTELDGVGEITMLSTIPSGSGDVTFDLQRTVRQ